MNDSNKFRRSNSKDFIGFLLLLMAGIMWAACTPHVPPSFFDGTCSPPCWAGIQPGITTYSESMGLLAANNSIEMNSINEFDRGNDHRVSWSFAGEDGGGIYFDNDIVSLITLYYARDRLTLGEIIDKLGQPENYMPVYESSEIFYLTIYYLYPELGVVVLGQIDNVSEGERVLIDGSLPIEVVYYFIPDQFLYEMTEGRIYGTLDPLNIQPWQGFGEIEIGE